MDRLLQKSRPVSGRRRCSKWIGGTAVAVALLHASAASAQTSFGSSTAIVFPVVAATSTFTGSVTLFNPNGSDITVVLDYFDANNLAVPGQKPCANVVVPANRSVQFSLASQCTLDATSHFGLLVAVENTGTHEFFGYSRTDNNAGAGFSIEGFPFENFSAEVSNATGLKSIAAAPGYQTNCFVASLAGPVSYDLALFDGTSGAQIGSTLSGSLNAFQQFRYLDIFTAAGAAPGDYSNVRAQFTQTAGGAAPLIGFCTVQDNVSFGADFRIAKSMTPATPPSPPPTTPTATWSGTMITLNANQASYIFMGPTTSVSLGGTSTVTAYGSGEFSRNTAGAATLSVGVCSQNQVGPGPVTIMPTPSAPSVSNSTVLVLATGSASLPAGTYNVGLCAVNNNNVSINKNGYTTGFVFVTP